MTREAVVTVHVAGLTQVRETLEQAAGAVAELTAERNRYRDALERIAEPLRDGTAPASWVEMAKTAREALGPCGADAVGAEHEPGCREAT